MKVEVVRPSDIGEDVAQRWRCIQEANASLQSPYFCPEFTRAVAEVRNDVRVAVVRDAGAIAAIFPFQRGPMGVGRPVGGPLSDHHGLVAPDDFEMSAGDLLRGCRLSSWVFDHCVASQAVFATHHAGKSESPVIQLSEGYAAYAEGRRRAGSKQILKAEGLARKLEREVGPLRFEASVKGAEVLRKCIAWKSSHYAQMGVRDIFGVGWTGDLLEKVLCTIAPGFAGMLSAVYAGDRLVAVHMGMRSRTVWHYWFPTYDAEMGKYSPGIILLLRMAEAAPSLGLSSIDLGKGATMYKDRLANAAIPIAEGCVELPSIGTSLRRMRRSSEEWIRGSPLIGVARVPGRFIKRAEKWLRFR